MPLTEKNNSPTGPLRDSGLNNLELLIQLRWAAVLGQVMAIEVVHYGFGITIPLPQMLLVLALLVAFNLLSWMRLHIGREVSNTELMSALLVDVAVLTAQLYLTGGIANPFASLYLLQVVLGAVLLPAGSAWGLVLVCMACLVGLSQWALPLALDHGSGLSSIYIKGLLVCIGLNAALLVTFVTRIMGNIRRRDARLAAARERASEEEHIVRMGLLASGAAHELGTPLSTLAVILGDWLHLPHFTSDPELLQEVEDMEVQVRRCKAIVSGILLSAGGARSESSEATTVRDFFDGLVAHWQRTRPHHALAFEDRFGSNEPMVADSALKQMVDNLLDNALEASPAAQRLLVERRGAMLILRVSDTGPGFAPQILAQLGKPYQSTKGRHGSGLGLFLVFNVARTLGGKVEVQSSPAGAEVTITLPLSAVSLNEEEDDA
jgi:two-component system sensor histidine kinase RegB